MAASLKIAWVSDGINIAGFIAERKNLTTGIFEEAGRTSATVLTWTDPNLLYNTKYTYRVCGFNAAGKSGPYSAEASTMTAAEPLPKAPTNLTVTPL